jgi:hypothetical protein
MLEAAGGSEFSHIGMIVRPRNGGSLRLWHAAPRPMGKDVLGDREHAGAQLNDLIAALARMTGAGHGGTPFVRQLIVEDMPEVDEEALGVITAVDQTPFPSSWKFTKDWVLGRLGIATSGKRMNCAEVVARTYQQMGLLGAEPPANAYTPRDFSERHMSLRLLRGAALGPQVEVLWSGEGSGAAREPFE